VLLGEDVGGVDARRARADDSNSDLSHDRLSITNRIGKPNV
jgi:hypothetical protein